MNDKPPELWLEETEAISASLLRTLNGPIEDQTGGHVLPMLSVLPAETGEVIASAPTADAEISLDHLNPPSTSVDAYPAAKSIADTHTLNHLPLYVDKAPRTHWLTRAMSMHGMRGGVAVSNVPQKPTHWMGDAMSAGLEQWLENPAGDCCAAMTSVPVDNNLPHTATGLSTTMELQSCFPEAMLSQFSANCADRDKYQAVSQPCLQSSAAPIGSIGTTGEAGSIEGATVELLRPLLRQWLNDSMTQLFEKALSSEAKKSAGF